MSSEGFTCGICDKTYTRNEKLKEHINTHFDLQPYSCDVCKTRFTRANEFRQHTKEKHIQEQFFQCGACSYRTPRKATLLRHYRTCAERQTGRIIQGEAQLPSSEEGCESNLVIRGAKHGRAAVKVPSPSSASSAHDYNADGGYQGRRWEPWNPLTSKLLTTDCFYSWTVVGVRSLLFCISLALALCLELPRVSKQRQPSISDAYDSVLRLYVPLLHRQCPAAVFTGYTDVLRIIRGFDAPGRDGEILGRYPIPEFPGSIQREPTALTDIEKRELLRYILHSGIVVPRYGPDISMPPVTICNGEVVKTGDLNSWSLINRSILVLNLSCFILSQELVEICQLSLPGGAYAKLTSDLRAARGLHARPFGPCDYQQRSRCQHVSCASILRRKEMASIISERSYWLRSDSTAIIQK
jgi:hypothetical protein